jgi:hypothetical protein
MSAALTECPKCSTRDIEGDGMTSQDFDESYATQGVTCNSCGCSWREVYKHSEQDMGA